MTSQPFDGVSPTVRLFLSELTQVNFGQHLYTRRANLKRAYMDYLERLGVNIKLSPYEFYTQVVYYFNELGTAGNVPACFDVTPCHSEHVVLGQLKGVDVIAGVSVPEFYGKSCGIPEPLKLDALIESLPKPKINW